METSRNDITVCVNNTSGKEKGELEKKLMIIWQKTAAAKLLSALIFLKDVQNVNGVGDDILRGRKRGQREKRHVGGTGAHLLFLNV